MKKTLLMAGLILIGTLTISCSNDDDTANDDNSVPVSKDMNTAEKVSVDRFSASAGHLMVRTATNGLPVANAPINMDSGPFITTGLDHDGNTVNYYNFDVQPTTPQPIYVLFKAGSNTPVSGQNNIIDVIPGDAGYNDFWIVKKVTVPDNYVPNSITSASEILNSGYQITPTNSIVNCPVVPFGSTANKSNTAGQASIITVGWYKNKAVAYFSFEESPLTASSSGLVPLSPIYVMFNINPDANNSASGPASGFKTENGTLQTHNVIATLPNESGYSPLWSVLVIDNTNFNEVTNLASASGFPYELAGANVNCPVVK